MSAASVTSMSMAPFLACKDPAVDFEGDQVLAHAASRSTPSMRLRPCSR